MRDALSNRMPSSWRIWLNCAVLLVALSTVGAVGCSFVLDFEECEASEDCRRFEQPDEGEFLVCSDEKCVVDPQRECRRDSHCDDDRQCQSGECRRSE